jgi:hypothetical protein
MGVYWGRVITFNDIGVHDQKFWIPLICINTKLKKVTKGSQVFGPRIYFVEVLIHSGTYKCPYNKVLI